MHHLAVVLLVCGIPIDEQDAYEQPRGLMVRKASASQTLQQRIITVIDENLKEERTCPIILEKMCQSSVSA